jgi:predicted GNAT family acetyltransferase
MIDNSTQNRFELAENGHIVFADYKRHDNRYVLVHVEADPVLRGTGAAGRLMEQIALHARAQKIQIVPRCGYAVAWFKRHPGMADVLN